MLIFELLDLAMKSFHLELKGNYYEQYFSKRYLFQLKLKCLSLINFPELTEISKTFYRVVIEMFEMCLENLNLFPIFCFQTLTFKQ